jgi:hypothetical protein
VSLGEERVALCLRRIADVVLVGPTTGAGEEVLSAFVCCGFFSFRQRGWETDERGRCTECGEVVEYSCKDGDEHRTACPYHFVRHRR